MTSKNITVNIVLILIMALSAVLFTTGLGSLSYWGDEVGSMEYALLEFYPMMDKLITEDVHPPLYYMVLHGWVNMFGQGEWAVRFLSVIMAVLSLAVVFKFVEENINTKAALIVTLLLAVSPEYILFGRMARYYSFAFFFATCSTYFFFNILKKPSRRLVLYYAVSSTILLYLTYATLSVLIAQAVIILSGAKIYRKSILSWIASMLIAFVLYIPGIILFLMMVTRMSGEIHPVSDLGGGITGLAAKLFFTFYAFCFGESLFPWRFAVIVPGAIVMATLFVLALIRARKMPDRNTLSYLILVIVPVLFTVFIFSTVKTMSSFVYAPSRTLFALPYFYMIIVSGLLYINKRWVQNCSVIVILSVFLISTYNCITHRDYIMPTYLTPWSEALREINKTAGPDDVMVSEDERETEYYYDRDNYPFRFIKDDEAVKEYLTANPGAKLYYIKTGRDQQPSGTSEDFRKWINDNYDREQVIGYVEIDEEYRRLKKLLLKREPYKYKMELLIYKRK